MGTSRLKLLGIIVLALCLSPVVSCAQPPGGKGRASWSGFGSNLLESSPLPKRDTEQKILSVLDRMARYQRSGMQNVPIEDGRLLRLLIETIGAVNAVEIGTSNGYSSLWILMALQTTNGHLTTFDIDPERLKLAKKNFKDAGVEDLVTVILGDAHKEVSRLKGPIDVLFLDADKEGYLDYLDKLMPLIRPGGLVIAHNMNPQMAYPPYVEAVTTNPDFETIFLNTHLTGVGVTLKKR